MTAQPQPQPPRASSPTPSEKEELERGIINWKKVFRWQTWLQANMLFGHEIVAVLCGVVWGLWIGFAIVCAGTLVGEIGNFYAFRYCLRGRAIKMEKKNPSYACLARVVRDGGFLVAFVVRLSAIPGHFTTAVFSTCGMNIWIFTLAAFCSLPKQFITVYLGVILEQSADGTRSTRDTIISDSVLAVTFLITVIAAWWIWREMSRVKLDVLRERREERKAKLAEAGQGMELSKFSTRGQSEDTSADHSQSHLQAMMSTDRLRAASTDHLAGAFNPRDSDDAIAIHSYRTGGPAQRWDHGGRAVDESGVYGQPYSNQRRHEPAVPARAYDGTLEPSGGMDGYAPYDPYSEHDNSPPQNQPHPQPLASRSPPTQPASPPQQPSYPPSQPQPFAGAKRYELFDRPVPRHGQESTIGTYRTAYEG
ncbi:Golgi apparatus membrane protein TVP38 [Ceratobasidium sp. AG-Ba]|nr:Golgi apparatus membrane protein TVP38 [Ceratobasidium sp. AG-Ba]